MASLGNPALAGSRLVRIAIALLVVAALAVSAYYRRRADATGGAVSDDDGPYRLLRVVGLVFAAALVTYLLAPEWVAWASLPIPAAVRYGGAVLSMAALPLLVWVFRSLRGNVTGTSATRADHDLVTDGPYRWIRHPLYTFATVFWAGICLLAANWLLLVLLATGLLGVHLRTPLEEQRLVDEFGEDYLAYAERTGRYLPRIRRRS